MRALDVWGEKAMGAARVAEDPLAVWGELDVWEEKVGVALDVWVEV